MLPYLVLYLYLAIKSISENHKISIISSLFLLVLLTIFIGFRYEIGVDWDQYLYIVEKFKDASISDIFSNAEPGYMFISSLGGSLFQDNGIYFVNLIGAAIFSAGLISYSRNRDFPWLSILIAFPILIVSVAMGYTRQAIAIGIEFFALIEIEKGRRNRAIFIILLAATFHLPIFPLLIVFFRSPRKNIFKIKFIIPAVVILFLTYSYINIKFAASLLGYYRVCIASGDFSSSGAIYRIIPSLIAALLILINKSKFKKYYGEISNLYLKFAYTIILFTLLIIIFPSNSTFIDRFALYLLPLKIFVFTSITKLKLIKIKTLDFKLLIVFMYFLYTFTWLGFAVHAYAWVPYKNFLFM